MADDGKPTDRSSKTVGHLIQGIVTSLRPEAGANSGLGPRPSGSATSTAAPGQSGPIGRPAGGSGFSVVTPISPPDPAKVLLDPLKAMPSSFAGSVVRRYETRDDPILGFCSITTSYEITKPLDAGDCAAGRATLERVLRPCPMREIVSQLRLLWAMTAAREIHEDQAVTLAAYAGHLEDVPEVALKAAIRIWVNGPSGKWRPMYAELRELVDAETLRARLLLEALR